jgi:hypothetical protein
MEDLVIEEETLLEKPDAELVCTLSIEDWYRILEKHFLDRQCLNDLRIITTNELRNKSMMHGLFIGGAYRVLFLDVELLILLEEIKDDEAMSRCSEEIALFWGAKLTV